MEPLKMELKLNRKPYFDKVNTRLYEVEEVFINEQLARQNSKHTIAHYRRGFKKLYEFLAFECAEDVTQVDDFALVGKQLPLLMLEMDDIQGKYIRYLTEVCEVNQQTVNSYLRDFKAIMYYCMDNEWIERKKIVIKQAPIPIKNIYTDAEIKRLLVKPDVDNFTYYRDWVIINYLLSTGNRVNTIVNLKVGDVNVREGYVNILVQKSGDITRIPLVKKCCRVLEEYIGFYRSDEDGEPLWDEYLFCNQYGEKLSVGALQKSIANYNLSRGVNKTSIHLFRHTYAAEWIKEGGSTASLQKMLGHSTLNAVQHYLQIYGTDLQPLAEEFAPINKQQSKGGKTLKRRK